MSQYWFFPTKEFRLLKAEVFTPEQIDEFREAFQLFGMVNFQLE